MKNELNSRREQYYKLSSQLAHSDNNKLDLLLSQDENKTRGWGKNHIIKIGKSKVFVKVIPLTNLEYQNMFSTKNHYNLPTYYNYGVGSAGFGAFRELVTHIKTTNWVLSGEIENFPLMYHYRIRPCSEKVEIDLEKHKKYVEKWGNNNNISEYIIERKNPSHEIVLFLEYIPYRLYDWLGKNRSQVNKVVSEIGNTISFLQDKGIIHFDAHLGNIITDGEKMYLTDFGLVLDRNFDLNEKEQEFFKQHIFYDYGEFVLVICFDLLSIFNKKKVQSKLKKFLTKESLQDHECFIIFLKNIEELNNEGVIQLDKNYIELVRSYYEIIVLFSEFFQDLKQNNKKDTKYNHKKLANLLKKTDLLTKNKDLN